MSEQDTKPAFADWAILELMGHRRLAGFVSEVELFGRAMVRLDVPSPVGSDKPPVVTQFYGPEAIYCLTPATEEVARAVAARSVPEPVHRWELAAPAGDEPGLFDGE